jgi:hypothetical protein
VELVVWMDGGRLQMFFTRKEDEHSTRKIWMVNTTPVEESEEFEEYEVETVAGRKYMEGRFMDLIGVERRRQMILGTGGRYGGV